MKVSAHFLEMLLLFCESKFFIFCAFGIKFLLLFFSEKSFLVSDLAGLQENSGLGSLERAELQVRS